MDRFTSDNFGKQDDFNKDLPLQLQTFQRQSILKELIEADGFVSDGLIRKEVKDLF